MLHDVMNPVLAVRGRYDGVRTVFTGRVTQGLELYNLVEVIIAICIEETKDATTHSAIARVDDYVEAVEGVADALRMANLRELGELLRHWLGISPLHHFPFLCPDNRVSDRLDTGRIDLFAQLRDGKAIQPTVLVAGDKASLVVLTHGNPGSLLFSRHGIQQLDFESVGQADPLRGRCAALGIAGTGEAYDKQQHAEDE